MSDTIFTAGYEGITIAEFLARLRLHGIQTLVDVRAVPQSRKKGFSKNGLSEAVRAVGIEYVHLPAMGCPKTVRDRYKLDGDWSAYTRAFLAYIAGEKAAVSELAAMASKSSCCLLCFEEDYRLCHRSYVAREVAKQGQFTVRHIIDQRAIPDFQPRSVAA